jgi:hypothetical protein
MNTLMIGRRFAMLLLVTGGLAIAQQSAAEPQIFDVRNGDQQGKLIFKEDTLGFESLSDARQSRTWKYGEIREVSKKRKEVIVRPFKGSRYAFQFPNNGTRDRIHTMISDRVVAARQSLKK